MPYTRRSDFPDTLPVIQTYYCWTCHAPGASRRDLDDGTVAYTCSICGGQSARVLIHDPIMSAWFDDQERLVHESCGIFITRGDGKLLLFQRTKFPYLLTIPAGHLEAGEAPDVCAVRECKEEVGIEASQVRNVFEGTIEGDSCLGGADIHKWHAYETTIDSIQEAAIQLDEEGSSWGWYSQNELHSDNTVYPVLHLLARIG